MIGSFSNWKVDATVLLALCCGCSLFAQDLLNFKGTDRQSPLKYVGIDQKLNAQLPLDTPFHDETGRTVKLGDYFGKRPVVLALVYYTCPMLCTQILNGTERALKLLSFDPGKEFEVVVVSFDARETSAIAAAKKAVYMKAYNRPGTENGWHFLTGDVDSIKALTSAVGFRYVFDPHTNQFAHASAIYVATPQGRMSRYFYGIEYSAKDIRFGLIEASKNKIGNAVDQILLFCYHYDASTGKYTTAALGFLRLAGGATVLLLGGFVVIMLRRESKPGGRRAA